MSYFKVKLQGRRVAHAATVALAIASIFTLTETPASAAATAYNTRTSKLAGSPDFTMQNSCTSRTIYLAEGSYVYSQKIGASSGPARTLKLLPGDYEWWDCMMPNDGFYNQQSTLSFGGYPDVVLNSTRHLTTGTYTFGSFLQPNF